MVTALVVEHPVAGGGQADEPLVAELLDRSIGPPDPRAADLALQALGDVHSPRWTLATPIWDYRLAAAQLLASLGQGGRGLELVQRHLDQALATGEINDIFSNLLLLATLADKQALPIFAALKPRWAGAATGDAAAARALQQYETQLLEALKLP